MNTNIVIKFGSDTVTMSWDGAQASAPILVDGEPTGYQTADARHRTADAVRLAAGRVWPEENFEGASDAWAQLGYSTVTAEDVVVRP